MSAISYSCATPSSVTRRLVLSDWGVMSAQGDDAAAFLHSQLTQDLLLLEEGQARLTGLCSAKGRLLATMVALKINAGHILLLTPRANLAPTLKRLSMFVLRAKVKLSDASAQWQVLGQLGPQDPSSSVPWQVKPWPQNAAGPAAGHEIVLYPSPGASRSLLLMPADQAVDQTDFDLPKSAWDCAEVLAGVAFLHGEVLDMFVPQMLNYESVGGVSFKKGCYPGQEVVARSQFRGTLKRRLFIAQVAATDLQGDSVRDLLHPGVEVFTGDDAIDQPSGVVVQSAPCPQGGACVLLVLQTDAVTTHAQDLHVLSPRGPQLNLQPLPYELLHDL